MSRIRSVHPGLASDEAFMTMTMTAKAAWSLLWTECDDHGVFEWKPVVLKARIFPAESLDFSAVLAEWEALGCVKRVVIEGKPYGLVRNFCKYQKPKHASYRFPWLDELCDYVGVKPGGGRGEDGGKPTEIPALMEDGVGEGGEEEEKKIIPFKKNEEDAAREPDPFASFPEDGCISYSPWASVIRKHAPGFDVDHVASKLREWMRFKDIAFNDPTIMGTVVGFCRTFKARNRA